MAHHNGECAGGGVLGISLNGYPFFNFRWGGRAKDVIDQSDSLTAVGSDGLLTVFQFVQLFQDGYGNEYLMLFKVQDRVWIVNQDVTVEYVGCVGLCFMLPCFQGVSHRQLPCLFLGSLIFDSY